MVQLSRLLDSHIRTIILDAARYFYEDTNSVIQQGRISLLNNKRYMTLGQFVVYWMQASQRAEYNHALEYAIITANKLNKPLVVYFGITDRFPEANERHYYFMLEGLREVKKTLGQRKIGMTIRLESPEVGIVRMSKLASLIVVDMGYLRIQRQWRSYVSQNVDCPLIQVESDVVIPIEQASAKEEYSAATFRPKIRRLIPHYLTSLEEQLPSVGSLDVDFESVEIEDIDQVVSKLDIDRSVKRVSKLQGGTKEAKKHLERFLEKDIDLYPQLRNDPNSRCLSNMSPYLHFGQISPLYIALRTLDTRSAAEDVYLEELVVRRELSMNYVFYNPNYDSFEGLPKWARTTLLQHERDRRKYTYSFKELEDAETDDPYWNAAQNEMRFTGKMHGYMRMYWGKKILEWSCTPRAAFQRALYLNNKYEIDGRDPNGFTGIAWCFGKHDRPWAQRPVFGNVRYMNAQGLRRKFDADAYAKRYTTNPEKLTTPTDDKLGLRNQD